METLVGQKQKAKDKLNHLRKDLTKRGVNQTVLNSIKEPQKQM